MNLCSLGFHKYSRWSLPERADIPDGFSVRFYRSSVVQHRTCQRCGYVDVRQLDAEINPPAKGDAQAEE